MRDPRAELAERIAGEVALSEEPGATLRKWREEFDVAQTRLAEELDVSSSVVSDYESGRRENPGIRVVSRVVEALLTVDERRGGDRVRQHARVLSAGFDSDVVHDLREYETTVPLRRFRRAIDAGSVVAGTTEVIAGHTVINSVEAIKRLSSEEFYRLYGQSTNRALVFTNVTRGESPLVALRVVTPTPSAVVLHGIALATTTLPLEELLETLREFP
ncbi:transcriptional regulator [Halobacteriales archaeon QS_8_69_73]|nr:MAG: transcriptional regulator [Halobacteriales archaeon QS_8_69_73]